jgi:hypothetical protein
MLLLACVRCARASRYNFAQPCSQQATTTTNLDIFLIEQIFVNKYKEKNN